MLKSCTILIVDDTSTKSKLGPLVKRLRHRPFTAVTGVQIPLESLNGSWQVLPASRVPPTSYIADSWQSAGCARHYNRFAMGLAQSWQVLPASRVPPTNIGHQDFVSCFATATS